MWVLERRSIMGLMEPSSSSCFVNILSERDSSAYHLALHWRPPRVGRKRKINQRATLYWEWLNCVIVSDLINMVTIEWFRDDMRLNKSKSVTRCVRSSFSTHKMTLLTGWHGFQIFIAIARFVANCLRFNQTSLLTRPCKFFGSPRPFRVTVECTPQS